MRRFTFNLPDIGEGIAEAEIVAWHVKVGDQIEEDGRLADMMTDKATVEMESPVAGKVVEIAGEVGDTIAIGAALVVIETDDQPADEDRERDEAALACEAHKIEEQIKAADPDLSEARKPIEETGERPPTSTGPADAGMSAGSVHRSEPPGSIPSEPVESLSPATSKVLATPAVRRRARDLRIDLAQVRPGEEGRVRHADLDAFIAYGASGGFAPAGQRRLDETVKVIGLRRRIAENMAAAKRNIPHFTYVDECDVTELETVRAQLNQALGERPKLTMLPLLIAAICRALPDFPMINARYDDEAGVVTRHGAVHLGMATRTEGGLMVPVIRDAQAKNLWQLAGEIGRLAEAARDGSAKSDELSGSTLTVTSLGPLGGVATTPVINRPEVAIIAPNRIVERPKFVPDGMGGERIEKRKTMNLSISCDHRVVDGWDAASFVQAIKTLIQTPSLLLVGDR